MNIYQTFANYMLESLVMKKEMEVQKSDIVHLLRETKNKNIELEIIDTNEPGWVTVSLV